MPHRDPRRAKQNPEVLIISIAGLHSLFLPCSLSDQGKNYRTRRNVPQNASIAFSTFSVFVSKYLNLDSKGSNAGPLDPFSPFLVAGTILCRPSVPARTAPPGRFVLPVCVRHLYPTLRAADSFDLFLDITVWKDTLAGDTSHAVRAIGADVDRITIRAF